MADFYLGAWSWSMLWSLPPPCPSTPSLAPCAPSELGSRHALPSLALPATHGDPACPSDSPCTSYCLNATVLLARRCRSKVFHRHAPTAVVPAWLTLSPTTCR